MAEAFWTTLQQIFQISEATAVLLFEFASVEFPNSVLALWDPRKARKNMKRRSMSYIESCRVFDSYIQVLTGKKLVHKRRKKRKRRSTSNRRHKGKKPHGQHFDQEEIQKLLHTTASIGARASSSNEPLDATSDDIQQFGENHHYTDDISSTSVQDQLGPMRRSNTESPIKQESCSKLSLLQQQLASINAQLAEISPSKLPPPPVVDCNEMESNSIPPPPQFSELGRLPSLIPQHEEQAKEIHLPCEILPPPPNQQSTSFSLPPPPELDSPVQKIVNGAPLNAPAPPPPPSAKMMSQNTHNSISNIVTQSKSQKGLKKSQPKASSRPNVTNMLMEIKKLGGTPRKNPNGPNGPNGHSLQNFHKTPQNKTNLKENSLSQYESSKKSESGFNPQQIVQQAQCVKLRSVSGLSRSPGGTPLNKLHKFIPVTNKDILVHALAERFDAMYSDDDNEESVDCFEDSDDDF